MPEHIFVTGATGFLGSHVVDQLLKQGYHVRAAARGEKAKTLPSVYANNPNLEVVEISDIARGDFGEALQGIDGVIHVASPLPSRADEKEMLKSAIDGTVNVLRQAEKAGVKKFVVTNWNPLQREETEGAPMWRVYEISKKYAELAVWEWAEKHPHVEVTTINPPFLYGPALPSFPTPPGDFSSISSNLNLFQLLSPSGEYPPNPGYADFRDVAKAHIGALHSPPTKDVGRKRIVFASPRPFVYKDLRELVLSRRPEWKERFTRKEPPKFEFHRYTVDWKRIELVTGLKEEEFYSLEDTILGTLDSLLKIEADWKSQGYEFKDIPTF
ncbi:hypothetical protein BDQ17DRAFT_1322478 [Cyathus striatus]|nr:hypothetical protein BDQ17DRAFT_1322478 [Cyathus striatus]